MKHIPLAVVFDWDNTLVDTKNNISNAIEYTLKIMGYDSKTMDKSFYQPTKNYMINLFGDRWEKANEIYKQYLDNAFLQNITLNKGVKKMLKRLKSHNIYLAIVSNKKNINLRQEVDFFKLKSYFKKIVGSSDTKEDKPSAIPLLFALKESVLSINEKNVFFIGDSITDILCAQNANCLPIIYGKLIKGYENLLYFQHFNNLTNFIIKYLKNKYE